MEEDKNFPPSLIDLFLDISEKMSSIVLKILHEQIKAGEFQNSSEEKDPDAQENSDESYLVGS